MSGCGVWECFHGKSPGTGRAANEREGQISKKHRVTAESTAAHLDLHCVCNTFPGSFGTRVNSSTKSDDVQFANACLTVHMFRVQNCEAYCPGFHAAPSQVPFIGSMIKPHSKLLVATESII